MTLKDRFTLVSASLIAGSPIIASADDPIDGLQFTGNIIKQGGNHTQNATFQGVAGTLQSVLGFVRGAGIVVCIIMLAWCAIQLAMSAGNQQKRAMAMEGIKNTMIAVAIIGGCTLIASLAYGILLQ